MAVAFAIKLVLFDYGGARAEGQELHTHFFVSAPVPREALRTLGLLPGAGR